jgi:nicotinamide-nucleotide amidase
LKAEIVTIGDEILLGHVVDTDAAYIADQISSVGIDLSRIVTIGDGDSRIVDAIKESLTRVDLVITTGGLGPTDDDLTKMALCRLFDTRLVFHQDIMDPIIRRYERRGLKIPELVRDQGELPDGATLFPNPIGSAVGILMEREGKRVISLPGVPQEMKAIMQQSVIPYIQNLHHGYNVIFKKIQTFGTFESYITDMLKKSDFSHEGVELAYLPSLRGVVIRLTYRGNDRAAGQALLDQYTGRLKEILGDYYVSDDGDI